MWYWIICFPCGNASMYKLPIEEDGDVELKCPICGNEFVGRIRGGDVAYGPTEKDIEKHKIMIINALKKHGRMPYYDLKKYLKKQHGIHFWGDAYFSAKCWLVDKGIIREEFNYCKCDRDLILRDCKPHIEIEYNKKTGRFEVSQLIITF